MKNWKEYHIDLGVVKHNTDIEVTFISNRELDIKNITTSCGCTKPEYFKEDNKLVAIFSSGNIPYHLKNIGSYTTTKTISLWYDDTSNEQLTFSAKVINDNYEK